MKRKRWTIRLIGGWFLAGALGMVSASGCKQQLFTEPADHDSALNGGLMAKLTTAPHDAIMPTPVQSKAAPITVLDTNRPVQSMTLKQAIAIGMESGNVGGASTNPGFVSDQLPTFTGRGTTGTDSLQAFALAPAVAKAEIERSLSKFDARWITSMTWNNVDQPTLSLQQSFSNGDTATLSNTLAKPLPTGGVAGITFSTQYLKLSQPPTNSSFVSLTSSYTPTMQFVFEQPLLQSFGIEANELNAAHPGSFLIQGFRTTGQGTEGILITRLRADQQRAEFDRLINQHLLNVEAAYWNLYAAYYNLAAQEEGAKQSLSGYQFVSKRVKAGLDRNELVKQNEAQYWSFRGDVVRARGQVLEAERNLRGLLGMRSDDGTRIVPVDEPTYAPFQPNWDEICKEANVYRPELMIARQDVKFRQLDLLNQKNLRRPDLRLLTSYSVAGLGPRLDGANVSDNAFRSLATGQFASWQIGLRLEMPIGFRDANGLVRQANLNLNASYRQLLDAERKAEEVLVQQHRRVVQAYEEIIPARNQRLAITSQLEYFESRKETFTGTSEVLTLIQAQQGLASATAREYRAIADYNTAIASLEHAKGTIQRYNNVSVAEGPLPAHVQKKAADHFAASEAALKLREHPADMPLPSLPNFQPMDINQVPGVTPPQVIAPSLPTTPAAPPKPMVMPATPPPMSSGTGIPAMPPAAPRQQLVPADGNTAGTFTPSGSVTLPSRNRPSSPVSTGTGMPQ
jgi:outer membrane protein TolC